MKKFSVFLILLLGSFTIYAQVINTGSVIEINNLNTSTGSGKYYYVLPILSPSDASTVSITNLAQMDFMSRNEVHLSKGFHAGTFTGGGYFHAVKGSSQSAYYINDNSRTGDIFCSAIGSDVTGNGTVSAPYATLGYVLSHVLLADGDQVYIDAGNYNEPGEVVFDPNEGGATIIGAGQNLTYYTCKGIIANGATQMTIENMNITNIDYDGGILLADPSTSQDDHTITIDAAGSDYWSILNCTVNQLGPNKAAIEINTTGNTISGCTINSLRDGVYEYYYASYNTIQNNTINVNNHQFAGISMETNNSINVSSTVNELYKDNKINGGQFGFYLNTNVGKFDIYNNYVSNCDKGIESAFWNVCDVYFNSFYTYNNVIDGTTQNWNIKNNIFYTMGGSGSYCLNTWYTPTSLDNNLYYHPNGAGAANMDRQPYTTLALLKKKSGAIPYEPHGAGGNPNYNDPGTGNLDIIVGSPATGKGTPVSSIIADTKGAPVIALTTDIINDMRNSLPAIGAYEATIPDNNTADAGPNADTGTDTGSGSGSSSGTSTINTSLPVGTTIGTASVTPTGAANYSIPIFVSPGTNGLQPKISIAYNSQAHNGELGIGWGITGLSSITRVSQNLYFDRQNHNYSAINPGERFNSSDDRFALDGNRLIVKNGAIYGADIAEYGTELESNMKITSSGSSLNGTLSFTVITKDGSILEYGTTTDSRVMTNFILGLNQPIILQWRIHKITDANGNYITFTYGQQDGESWINEIDYTNDQTKSNTYNAVNFYYDIKADAVTLHSKGLDINQSKILRKIQSSCEGNLVHEYDFNYTNNNSTDFVTHLNEIVEKAGDGTQLNSTLVEHNLQAAPYTITQTSKIKPLVAGDFNGDGITDIIDTDFRLQTGTISGQFNAGNILLTHDFIHDYLNQQDVSYGSIVYKTKYEYLSLDFNGDGLSDLVIKIHTYNSTGVYNPSLNNGKGGYGQWVDSNHKIKYYFYQSSGNTFTNVLTSKEYDYNLTDNVGDFNGDGKSELLLLPVNGLNPSSILAIDQEYTVSGLVNLSSYKQRGTGDFNGDGMTDVYGLDNNKQTLTIIEPIIVDATKMVTFRNFGKYFPYPIDTLYTGDFNGDGNTDFLVHSNGSWQFYYSNGL